MFQSRGEYMQNFTTSWRSSDGLELFAQGWRPENSPKAVVCLVHGLGEHSSRYTHVAEALTQAGYAVVTFDLRGHGRSSGPRGHFPNLEAVLGDIDCLFKEADQRYPGLPRFLYGHRLGGVLVLYYTLRRRPALYGVVSTSPGLRTALEKQKGKIALSKALSHLAPSIQIPTGLDCNGLSHDRSVVEAYLADPLVHGKGTPAFATNILNAIQYTFEHAGEFPAPLLMMHGTEDPITYPSGSQEFAQCVNCSCTVKLWEGMYHETHNEVGKEEVIAFLIEWLDSRLPEAARKTT
jgi:alpha-beta hydrolase superfamily lysophospholipase